MATRIPLSLLFGSMAFGFLGACEQTPEGKTVSAGAPALLATDSSKDFGDYVIHFSALATDQLTAEVAKTYGIVRSPNRAMLNVSILRKTEGTAGTPVAGSVSASANNLTGQIKQITVRELREGEAIYYIGEVTVANEENLIFNVDVTPMNETSRFSIRFQKQFFTD